MTDLDDLPFDYPDPAPATPNGARPKPHRHDWGRAYTLEHVYLGDQCIKCDKWKDAAAAKRGRNNDKRGKRIQRQRIVGLGGKNLAGNNPNLDGLGIAFRYESKSGGSFPELPWRWLKGIPVQAGQTAVLIITDAPGPGHRARSVVVVDYDDWRDLHGEETP